ncbi:MAG: serine/threonine-protein kinase [Planctomycetota bacterium]
MTSDPTPPGPNPGDDKKTVRAPVQPIEPTRLGESAAPTGASDALVGQEDLIPGYRLVAKLGEGGMGVVYRAVQLSLNREVAIKVMKVLGNDSDTGFQARFKREALAAAKLNHPNIVSIFDHGSAHGTIYMVLEFIHGKDCGEVLHESGPYEEKSAFELIRDVVSGLDHAADQGVIHRDIKPANIMVAYPSSNDASRRRRGVAKLTDFGIAALRQKAREPGMTELTQQGTVIGTPGYMSPEQSMGKEVDFRSDIYSLGCTLYYLLTGKPPYFGQTAIEVFHNKMTQQIPNPQDLRQGVSAGAVHVISKMMARDSADRYEHYDALLDDIDAVLEGRSPEGEEVPFASQSIAPALGDSGATEVATALAATMATPAARPAGGAARAPAASGGRGKWLAIAGVVGVLAIGGGAFFVLKGGDKGGEQGGGGGTSESGDVASFLDAREGESAETLVASLEAHRDRFAALLAGIDAVEERAEAQKRWTRIADKAVRDTDRARTADLEALRDATDWSTFLERAARARAVHDIAGGAPAGGLRRILDIENDVRAKGADERRDWAAIAAATTDEDKRERLKAYLAAYDFSPKRSEATGMLNRLPESGAQLAAAEKLVVELAELSDEAFLLESKALAADAEAAFETLKPSENARLKRELRRVLRERREKVGAGLVSGLTAVWKRGDYAALEERLTQVKQDFADRLELRPDDEMKRLERVVDAAVTKGLGAKEREIVAQVAATRDEAEIPGLLAGFEETYWFSPDLDAMKDRLSKARVLYPSLGITCEGGPADLLIDGVPKGATPWEGGLSRGPHQIELRRKGFFPYRDTLDHQEESRLELALFPRPASPLKVGSSTYNLPLLGAEKAGLRGLEPWGSAIGGMMREVVENAAVQLTSADQEDGWAESTLPLKSFLQHRNVSGGKGWRITMVLRRITGEAEVRLKEGTRSFFFRATADGFFVGSRDGAVEKLHRCPGYGKMAAGVSQVLSIEWHGDVVVVRPGTTASETGLIGSVDPGIRFGAGVELAIAVKKGDCHFGEMRIEKLEF